MNRSVPYGNHKCPSSFFETFYLSRSVFQTMLSLLLKGWKSITKSPFIRIYELSCSAVYNSLQSHGLTTPSMRFSRQEYWSGLPFLPPGHVPNPGIEPAFLSSPALQADSLSTEPMGRPSLEFGHLHFCEMHVGIWGRWVGRTIGIPLKHLS